MAENSLTKKLKKSLRQKPEFSARIISTDPDYNRRELIGSCLPKGCTLSDPPYRKIADMSGAIGTAMSNLGGWSGDSAFYHTQRPYLPEFDSPDRQWYPRNIAQANYYWRMYYKYDPFFGTAVEMYSQMMLSEFDIQLSNGDDQTVKNTLLEMCEETRFLDAFQNLIREFLVCGEAFPNCFFDAERGIWTYIGFHNPDTMEVVDNPIINMQPIINYIPDDKIVSFLSQNTIEAQEIRSKLPSEFVSRVMSHQKIRLNSTNCSFIPRKQHPYDLRGTSLASRLWRILNVEDAVYNATLATFRRNAGAIRALKIGDSNSGIVASPEIEEKLMRMVKQAEIDPNAWLITNYLVNFEPWGSTERAITLNREYDTIEKVKLTALGLSKSFMTGEVSFSSAKSGLQVFLRRLLSMRQFFEKCWIIPKFFGPIIKVNDFSTGTPAEVNNRLKVRRTGQEALDRGLLIMPKIKWKNKLDPTIDAEVLTAYQQLKNFGVNISMDTASQTCSLDWREEERKAAKEFKEREELLIDILGPTLKEKYEREKAAPPKASPPGLPGAGAKPPSGAPPGLPTGSPAGGAKGGPGAPGESHPPGSAEVGNTPSNEPIESPEKGMGKLI